MAATEIFHTAVREHNLTRVRYMMKDSLLIDPSFREFDEMDRAAAGMGDLYVPHDGTAFRTDQTTWDEDYMNGLLVDMIDNFSKERIAHVKTVVRALHPASEAERAPQSSRMPQIGTVGNGDGMRSVHPKLRRTKSGLHPVVRGAMIGGAVLAIPGILLGGPVGLIGGTATGAVIGGSVAYMRRGRRIR